MDNIVLSNVDCLEYIKTIPDKSVDLILTDPPYNIAQYSTGNIPLPGRSAVNNDLGEWDLKEINPFDFVDDFKRILKPDGNIFIFTSYNLIGKWHEVFDPEFDTFQYFIWHKTNPMPKIFRKGETHLQRADRLAKPYLMRDIGGDALECVSDVAYANERGIDGIIHISPFTCMPEIMSQNIFPSMRENCEIPILPLIMDEQTGRAGYITRIEAFVDLMRRRKRKRQMNAKKQNETKEEQSVNN